MFRAKLACDGDLGGDPAAVDIIVEIPIAACRGLRHAGLRFGPGNPLVDTIADHAAGRHAAYAGSALARFHERWQPRSAAASMGLADPDTPPQAGEAGLAGLGPLEAVAPWWPDTGGGMPAAVAAHIRHRTAVENRESGISGLGAEGGVIFFGPVSARKGQVEYDRLIRVWASIRDRGYLRAGDDPHGDVTGSLLLRGTAGEHAVLIGAGQHRLAALAALGARSVPVRLLRNVSPRVVRREDVASWPHVRSGLFRREEALALFDRILEGRPPWESP
mgnify:FL=1